MIQIEHLTKRYAGVLAVDDLTMSAEAGRVTGFLGPNGAGKSTTLRLLFGLAVPTGGRASIDGGPYADLERPLTRAGALLDGAEPHAGITGRAHLSWMARSNGIGQARVRELLDLVGLGRAGSKRVGHYSLGMRQRLGIAAALLGDPPVLVLDEPWNGLDPEGIVWIRSLLRHWAEEGRTVLVSSHLMTEVARVADRLVVIAEGGLRAAGTVADVTRGHESVESAYFALVGAAGERA